MTEDEIDSENPRPDGHYPRFADQREVPVHEHCYAEAYGAPAWVTDH